MTNKDRKVKKESTEYRYLSVKQLMWRKFLHNRVAVASTIILIFIYIAIIFAEFFAPYNMREPHSEYLYSPPIRLRFIDYEGKIVGDIISQFLIEHKEKLDDGLLNKNRKQFNTQVLILLNGRNIKYLKSYKTNLNDGDELHLSYALAGG